MQHLQRVFSGRQCADVSCGGERRAAVACHIHILEFRHIGNVVLIAYQGRAQLPAECCAGVGKCAFHGEFRALQEGFRHIRGHP